MKKINTHNLTIKGLKAASGDTKNYGYYSGSYNEVFYDLSTGEVWTVYQYSLGQNTWTVYHDPNVIKICNTSEHLTMQELADRIAAQVSLRKAQKAWEAEIERQYLESQI